MQTILGAGGAVGDALARALASYTEHIRLVSRHPQPVNEDDELLAADLTEREDVDRAVEGANIAYLTVGFEYDRSIWKSRWPRTVSNVIEVCKKHGTSLVFFDNVYMYDPDHLNPMTEETPISPTSEKGKVRARIARQLMEESQKGELDVLIARSADFLSVQNSIPVEMILKRQLSGGRALWFCRTDKVHSFTYVPDAAKATALLGNTPKAYNQLWHLPTHDALLTGKDWIALCAGITGQSSKSFVLKKWMVKLMGWFIPFMGETVEMLYQYDRDYVFDSSKFETAFDLPPTPPAEAVREIVEQLNE